MFGLHNGEVAQKEQSNENSFDKLNSKGNCVIIWQLKKDGGKQRPSFVLMRPKEFLGADNEELQTITRTGVFGGRDVCICL